MNQSSRRMACGSLILGCLMLLPVAIPAEEPSAEWSIARGGQMYDKWWQVLGQDAPAGTHPAYPAAAGHRGKDSWRCKECHGWDYQGTLGAYGSGSHRTGIKGITASAGMEVEQIRAILRGPTHGFGPELIPEDEIRHLLRFVRDGQLDMDLHVDRATLRSRGEAARGARYYQTLCTTCHGQDGKLINFHDPEDPEFVGTVAQQNPWEFLHKVRHGQPGAPMISLITLPAAELADLLAYAQTLPAN